MKRGTYVLVARMTVHEGLMTGLLSKCTHRNSVFYPPLYFAVRTVTKGMEKVSTEKRDCIFDSERLEKRNQR